MKSRAHEADLPKRHGQVQAEHNSHGHAIQMVIENHHQNLN